MVNCALQHAIERAIETLSSFLYTAENSFRGLQVSRYSTDSLDRAASCIMLAITIVLLGRRVSRLVSERSEHY